MIFGRCCSFVTQNLVISCCCGARLKINARAEASYCLFNLLFGDILVGLVILVMTLCS